MQYRIKQFLALLLVTVILLGVLPLYTLADTPKSDEELIAEYQIPDNWARPALLFAVRNGLLAGKQNGLCPEDRITRAEAAAILMKLVGTSQAVDLSGFTDVSEGAWYYSFLSRACAVGLFAGDGNGKLRPNANITRQEAVTVIAGLIGLTGGAAEDLKDYLDWSKVSAWAKDAMMPMVRAGYLSGSGGYLHPDRTITRQEFVQILYRIFSSVKAPVGKKGVYILQADNLPEGTTVDGDVILCSQAEQLVLNNITVSGRLVLQGCGALSLRLEGCTVNTLALCRPTTLTADGSQVNRIVTRTKSKLYCDCTRLELHADTTMFGEAVSAAAVKGKLTVSAPGKVNTFYDAVTYREAQAITRVRIAGGTIRDTTLYQNYAEDGTFSKPLRQLAKGEVFTYRTRYGAAALVRMPDGTEGSVRFKDVYIRGDSYTTTSAYSDKVKTCFVNYIGDYRSNTGYLIWINRYTLKLTVFKGAEGGWSVLKTWPCATGKNSSPTAEGVRAVSAKKARCEAQDFYYHHATFFGGAYAMHSRLYRYDGTFYDDSISVTVSHGCVRLEDENAVWIYDNIPIGTTVVIY